MIYQDLNKKTFWFQWGTIEKFGSRYSRINQWIPIVFALAIISSSFGVFLEEMLKFNLVQPMVGM